MHIRVYRRREAHIAARRFAAIDVREHALHRHRLAFGKEHVIDRATPRDAPLRDCPEIDFRYTIGDLARQALNLHPVR